MDPVKQSLVYEMRRLFPNMSISDIKDILARNSWQNNEGTRRQLEEFNKQDAKRAGRSKFISTGGNTVFDNSSDDDDGGNGATAASAGDNKGVINQLFDRAERVSATEAPSAGGNNFFGTAHRVGHTTGATPAIASVVREEKNIALTLYSDGYTITDESSPHPSAGNRGEELFSSETPEAKVFFEEMARGQIPKELERRFPNCDLNVRLLDCMEMPFSERVTSGATAAKARPAFQGEGRRLTDDATGGSNSGGGGAVEISDGYEFHYDEAGEGGSTVIRFVLPSGEKVEEKVNPDRHTVADIYYLARRIVDRHGGNNGGNFSLVARVFPPLKLETLDKSLTITNAKLQRSVISIQF